VSVWLFDEKREGLVLQASCRGVDNRQVFEPGFTLPLEADQSIVVLVGRRGEFFLAEDVRADSTYLAVVELPDTRSELALPLQVGQEMLGVLDIQSDRLDAFNYEDVAVLQMLANQVAVAIQNARRYAQISRFNQELEDKVRQRTAELQKAYNRLELLDRNKSDFIKVVSHELRTPLTSIKLSAQILPGAKGDAEAATILQTVDQNVNRMYGIVNTMLDITKLDSQLLEKYDTNIVLSQVIAIAANKFQAALTERRLTLTPDDLEKLPPIYADDELLVKVFSHLIGNAIKYTPDGGAITITGFETTTPTGESAVEVVISDTGIGIDRAHHDLIFEKFYQTGEVALHSSGRTKFKGGGPGLGLAIARGIVRAHGGEIWVESEGYNEETCPGSRFHVQLPRGEIQEK
jgi:signal transduction histidine kinase